MEEHFPTFLIQEEMLQFLNQIIERYGQRFGLDVTMPAYWSAGHKKSSSNVIHEKNRKDCTFSTLT